MTSATILVAIWLSRLILALLVFLSIWSIAIMLDRRKFFKTLDGSQDLSSLRAQLRKTDAAGLSKLSIGSKDSIYSQSFQIMIDLKKSTQVDQALNSFVLSERKNWEKGLPLLGTLGSTAPFIGLLGTILGIIVAFGELSSGNMDSLKVMSALAEALTLTAIGLTVAIPAVIANNIFNRKILELVRNVESLKDAYNAYHTDAISGKS